MRPEQTMYPSVDWTIKPYEVKRASGQNTEQNHYRCQSSTNHKYSEPYIPIKSLESQIGTLYNLMEPSTKLLKLLKAEIEEVQNNFQAKSKNEIFNLKRKISENEAKMDALVDNLASRIITPEVLGPRS